MPRTGQGLCWQEDTALPVIPARVTQQFTTGRCLDKNGLNSRLGMKLGPACELDTKDR